MRRSDVDPCLALPADNHWEAHRPQPLFPGGLAG